MPQEVAPQKTLPRMETSQAGSAEGIRGRGYVMYLVQVNNRQYRLSAVELNKLQANAGIDTHIGVLDYCSK